MCVTDKEGNQEVKRNTGQGGKSGSQEKYLVQFTSKAQCKRKLVLIDPVSNNVRITELVDMFFASDSALNYKRLRLC
jgi:hypothetical protein